MAKKQTLHATHNARTNALALTASYVVWLKHPGILPTWQLIPYSTLGSTRVYLLVKYLRNISDGSHSGMLACIAAVATTNVIPIASSLLRYAASPKQGATVRPGTENYKHALVPHARA